MTDVLAGMTELARGQGYSNAQIDGRTIQKFFHDFYEQEKQRFPSPRAKTQAQSPTPVPADISSSVQQPGQNKARVPKVAK